KPVDGCIVQGRKRHVCRGMEHMFARTGTATVEENDASCAVFVTKSTHLPQSPVERSCRLQRAGEPFSSQPPDEDEPTLIVEAKRPPRGARCSRRGKPP